MARDRKRDGGIEAPTWWVEKARANRTRLGLRVEDVAERVSVRMRTQVDQSRISRCLNGTTSTIPLMESISVALGTAVPVFVADDEAEALELAKALAKLRRRRAEMLEKADQKAAKDRESAEKLADRQTPAVQSKDGGKAGRVAGGMGGGRGGSRKS